MARLSCGFVWVQGWVIIITPHSISLPVAYRHWVKITVTTAGGYFKDLDVCKAVSYTWQTDKTCVECSHGAWLNTNDSHSIIVAS